MDIFNLHSDKSNLDKKKAVCFVVWTFISNNDLLTDFNQWDHICSSNRFHSMIDYEFETDAQH